LLSWNYANLWETVANAVPSRPAQIHGGRVISWEQFDQRADSLARHFLDAGLEKQSKVAAYLHNGPEYLETYFAAFKAGLTPVNTNYRYVADELIYLSTMRTPKLWVFDAAFASTVRADSEATPKGTNLGRCIRPRRQGSSFRHRLWLAGRPPDRPRHRPLGAVGRRSADPLHRRHHWNPKG